MLHRLGPTVLKLLSSTIIYGESDVIFIFFIPLGEMCSLQENLTDEKKIKSNLETL